MGKAGQAGQYQYISSDQIAYNQEQPYQLEIAQLTDTIAYYVTYIVLLLTIAWYQYSKQQLDQVPSRSQL